MLSNDLTQIILLNPVKINYDLQKWNPEGRKDSTWSADSLEMISSSGGRDWSTPQGANVWDGVPFQVRKQFNSPFWRSVADKYIKFRLLFNHPKKNPVDFFMEVKDNFEELKNTDIPDDKISSMVTTLEKSRQKFAISTLVAGKAITKLENKLVSAGLTRYQTEESIVKFIKQCKKGLCLTEIEYFDRPIPDDAMDKFEKAELVGVFDNYYIMYHDPKEAKKKNYTTEKPKDPIMFGVIRGSNKLYFIADWIDELCNLTYKDILDQGIDYKLKMAKFEE